MLEKIINIIETETQIGHHGEHKGTHRLCECHAQIKNGVVSECFAGNFQNVIVFEFEFCRLL